MSSTKKNEQQRNLRWNENTVVLQIFLNLEAKTVIF